MTNLYKNYHFFFNKGKWIHDRYTAVLNEIGRRGFYDGYMGPDGSNGLENFKTAMKRNGKDLSKLKIGGFWDSSQDTVGGGDFAFFASSDKNNKSTLDLEATDLKWKEICDEKAFYPSSKGGEALNVDETSRTYVAVSTDFIEKIEEMMGKSKTLFNKLMTDEGGTMKATYTRAKRL